MIRDVLSQGGVLNVVTSHFNDINDISDISDINDISDMSVTSMTLPY